MCVQETCLWAGNVTPSLARRVTSLKSPDSSQARGTAAPRLSGSSGTKGDRLFDCLSNSANEAADLCRKHEMRSQRAPCHELKITLCLYLLSSSCLNILNASPFHEDVIKQCANGIHDTKVFVNVGVLILPRKPAKSVDQVAAKKRRICSELGGAELRGGVQHSQRAFINRTQIHLGTPGGLWIIPNLLFKFAHSDGSTVNDEGLVDRII